MNRQEKIKQYDDISIIQMKKKASTKSQNISNNHNLNPNMFRFIQSDLEDVDNKLSNTLQQSEQQDQSKQHRKKHSIFNTKMTQNETVAAELGKKTKILKPDVGIQKKMSINLTNSIPMALTFQKNKSKIENSQQRKFRIFPQIQTITFVLPNLDQYYTKVTTIKKQKQIQPNLNIQEPSEMSSTNNKQFNISASTFFGFGHNNDTKHQNPTDRPKKSFLQSNFVKSTKNDQKNAFKKNHDEIKQQQQDLENSQQLKDKLTNQKITDYKSKGIYLLLGFLLSIIIMIFIQKII